jgi:hypothetical protein
MKNMDSRYRIAVMMEKLYMMIQNNYLQAGEHQPTRVRFHDNHVFGDILALKDETQPRDPNASRVDKIGELTKSFQEDRIEELESEVKELRELVQKLLDKTTVIQE